MSNVILALFTFSVNLRALKNVCFSYVLYQRTRAFWKSCFPANLSPALIVILTRNDSEVPGNLAANMSNSSCSRQEKPLLLLTLHQLSIFLAEQFPYPLAAGAAANVSCPIAGAAPLATSAGSAPHYLAGAEHYVRKMQSTS